MQVIPCAFRMINRPSMLILLTDNIVYAVVQFFEQ